MPLMPIPPSRMPASVEEFKKANCLSDAMEAVLGRFRMYWIIGMCWTMYYYYSINQDVLQMLLLMSIRFSGFTVPLSCVAHHKIS